MIYTMYCDLFLLPSLIPIAFADLLPPANSSSNYIHAFVCVQICVGSKAAVPLWSPLLCLH